MSLPPPAYESFKIRLRLALREAGYWHETGPHAGQPNLYAFARVLDADDPQHAERNLRRWLSPKTKHLPTLSSRLALAYALGREPDFFDRKPGADEVAEIRRAFAAAQLKAEVVQRRVWAPPGGPLGGWFLTPEQRELLAHA